MSHAEAQANVELVLEWIDRLRRHEIGAIAERFHPNVVWEDVAGGWRAMAGSRCLPGYAPPHKSALRSMRWNSSAATTTSYSASAITPAENSLGCNSTANYSRSSRCAVDRSCIFATTRTGHRRSPTLVSSTTSGADTRW